MIDLIERLRVENERLRAEVERLRADLTESDEIRDKLRHLLTRTAAALKGEPPAGVWHSWHDLPERAAELRAEVAAWRELSDHVRVGACAAIWPDRYADARTRDVAAALKRAAWMAEAVETLRAEVEKVTCELMDATTRADRLAEALRKIAVLTEEFDDLDDAVGIANEALERENDDA